MWGFYRRYRLFARFSVQLPPLHPFQLVVAYTTNKASLSTGFLYSQEWAHVEKFVRVSVSHTLRYRSSLFLVNINFFGRHFHVTNVIIIKLENSFEILRVDETKDESMGFCWKVQKLGCHVALYQKTYLCYFISFSFPQLHIFGHSSCLTDLLHLRNDDVFFFFLPFSLRIAGKSEIFISLNTYKCYMEGNFIRILKANHFIFSHPNLHIFLLKLALCWRPFYWCC